LAEFSSLGLRQSSLKKLDVQKLHEEKSLHFYVTIDAKKHKRLAQADVLTNSGDIPFWTD